MIRIKFAGGFISIFRLLLLFSIEAKGQCTANAGSDVSICAGESIQLNGSASGGNGSYTYLWSNGLGTSQTPTVSPSSTTTYTLTITDGFGCTNTDQVVVTVKPLPTTTISPSPATVCSGASITLTASGGGTYSWSTNATTASISVSPTANTTYTVTVTLNGCTATATRTVNVNPKPDASLTGNGTITYNGQQYFRICANSPSLFTFGNTSTSQATNANYTISWGDGSSNFSTASWNQTTHTFAVGIYTLTYTVLGQNGCETSKTYGIFVGNTPAGGINSCGNADVCAGTPVCFTIGRTDGAGNLNAPGTTYTVTFSDGSPSLTFTEPNVPNTIDHTFLTTSCGHNLVVNGVTHPNRWYAEVVITNPCGTGGGYAHPVYVTNKPVANFIMPDKVCVNSSVQITDTTTTNLDASFGACTQDALAWKISPTPTNITGNLGFVFYNPLNISGGSSSLTVIFGQPGIYSVTHYVYNSACGADSIIKQICVQPIPTANFTFSQNPQCEPSTVQITNQSNTLNTCGNTTYNWTVTRNSGTCSVSGNGVFISGTSAASTNPTIRFDSSGVYTITQTVTNICTTATSSQTVTIKEKPKVNITVLSTICLGETVIPTASETPCEGTISGYSWSFPGGTPSSSTQLNPGIISYTTAGVKTITLTVTNECGSSTATTTVNVLNPPAANAGNDRAICSGTPITIGSTPQSGYTYNWTPATGLSSTSASNPGLTLTNTGSSPTTYQYILTVTDGNCTAKDTVVITVNPLPTVSINPNTTTICVGNSATLTASGGTSYSWNTGANTAAITVNPTSNTTYTVTVTNSYGCTSTSTATVTVNPLPNITINPNNPAICIGNSVTLTASGGSTYQWSTNATGSSITVSPPINTTYSVTGTNSNGCSNTATTNVTVNALPNVSATANQNVICSGQSVSLTATGASTYSWSPATGLNTTTGATVTASPIVTTTYTVTGTSGLNCQDTGQVTITVNPLPTVAITPNNPSICIGNSATLTASGGASYSWSMGATTAAITVNPTSNTTYTVTVTNSYGCTSTSTATVTVNPLPNITINPNNPAICIGNSVTLTASGGSTYQWSTNATGSSITVSPTVNTTYSVTGTNSNGCSSTATTNVTVNSLPNVRASANQNVICSGQSATLTATGASSYSWSPATGLNTTTGATVTASPTVTTTYIVTGTSGLNCQDTGQVTITVNPLPTVTITPNNPSICIGNSATLTASGGASYSWSTGANSAVITVSPASNTSYTVTVTHTNGCTNTVTATVTVNPLPVVNAGPDQQFCNQNIPVQLSGSPAGGSWSGTGVTTGGSFNPSLAGVGTWTLTYTYTNNNQCTNSDSMVATVINPTIANAGTGFSLCINAASVNLSSANPTPSGGSWSGNGVAGNSFNPSNAGAGQHVLTYTIGTGTCESSDTILVRVNPLPSVTISPANPAICFGNSTSLTASGGNSYTWNTGATTSSITVSPTTGSNYSVTVTDANGCSNTESKSVTVYPLPVVNAGPDQQFCNQNIPVQLTGSPAGGSWNGTGVTTGGSFNPSLAGVGTWTLTYTYTNNNQCTNSDSMVATVINPTIANAGTGFSLCINAASVNLSSANPTPSGGSWSGNGVAGNSFNPSNAGAGQHVLTYTIGTGTCESSDTILVRVNPLPSVTISPANPAICFGNSTSLTASGGNSYTWNTGATTSSITVSPTTGSNYSVTVTDANGCSNTESKSVTVYPLPVVNAGPDQQFCNQNIPVQLTGSPAGGSWNGTGVTTGGSFNPSLAGVGTWTITYTFTDNNQCSNSDNMVATVIDPTFADAGSGFAVCVSEPPLNLNNAANPTPGGGVWSGNGVSNNSFTPWTAGAGQHTLTYTIGTGTCQTSDTINVRVNPQPNLIVNSPMICFGDTVTLTVRGADTYSWSPSTGLSAANGSQVSAFPNTTISYNVIGIVSATGCKDTIISLVTVNPLPNVSAGPDQQFCNQNIPAQLSGTPSGGIWSGIGVNAGTFIPSQAGLGSWQLTYTYTDQNNCTNADNMIATVVDPVIADAGPGDTVCLNGGNILPISFSPTGGTWSGQGIINQSTGLFNPSLAGAGTHQLQYSFGSGTCLTTDARTILVHPLPTPTFNPSQPEGCFRHDVAITVSGAVSYSWFPSSGLNTTTGASVIANIDNTTTYYVDAIDQNNCRDTVPITVTIHPLPLVTAGPDTTICNQNSFSVQLPATPQGGQWTGSQYLSSTGVFTPGGNAADTGTYHVTYHFTDQHGCTDSSDMNVRVIAPTLAIAGPSDTFCLNDTPVLLQGFSPAGGVFAGPGIVNSQTGLFSPTSAGSGVKYIKYYYGSGTCLTVDSTFYYVRPLPHPDFTYSETCIGEPTAFTDRSIPSEGTITSWNWSFGDGVTSTSQNPVHTYSANGDYYATLSISNSVGCYNDTTIRVVIHPLPTVTFYNPPVGCPDSVIRFTLTTIDAVQYEWDFGDGSTGTGANPTHIYTNSGIFTIRLTATTQYNCVDSSFSTITIVEKPVANFAAYPDSGCGPLKVVIRYLPQTTSGGFDFTWALGNGDTVYSMIPPDTVVYAPPTLNADTAYYITAWVQSRQCQQIAIHRDTIRVYTPPKIKFIPDRTNGCAPLAVSLDNQTKGLLDSLIVDFGDGTETVLYNISDDVSHTFENTTNKDTSFVIRYIAVNGCGISQDSLIVTVFPNVVNASISITPASACMYQDFTLTNSSSGASYVYYDLGTGSANPVSNTSSTVIFSFDTPGDYVIYQHIYSGDSCSYDYDSVRITVHPNPISDFEAEQKRLECSGPIEVTFTNNSTGAIIYYWNFGDNSTDGTYNPIHVYENSGLYNVVLVSENVFGCRDTLPKSISAEHRKNILNVPNAFSPEYNSPGVNLFKPTGTCLKTYRIEVFNPWGERLWMSEKITDDGQPEEGWDGIYKNELAPQDVYVWKVLATFQNGEVWLGKDYGSRQKNIGSVTLIR